MELHFQNELNHRVLRLIHQFAEISTNTFQSLDVQFLRVRVLKRLHQPCEVSFLFQQAPVCTQTEVSKQWQTQETRPKMQLTVLRTYMANQPFPRHDSCTSPLKFKTFTWQAHSGFEKVWCLKLSSSTSMTRRLLWPSSRGRAAVANKGKHYGAW